MPSPSPIPSARHACWEELGWESVNPLFDRQFVYGEQCMLARIRLRRGCRVPEHRHANEQITYVLEGALRFELEGREVVVRAGETLVIPANLPHAAEALEDTLDLDIFAPPRQDWLGRQDGYLR